MILEAGAHSHSEAHVEHPPMYGDWSRGPELGCRGWRLNMTRDPRRTLIPSNQPWISRIGAAASGYSFTSEYHPVFPSPLAKALQMVLK